MKQKLQMTTSSGPVMDQSLEQMKTRTGMPVLNKTLIQVKAVVMTA